MIRWKVLLKNRGSLIRRIHRQIQRILRVGNLKGQMMRLEMLQMFRK